MGKCTYHHALQSNCVLKMANQCWSIDLSFPAQHVVCVLERIIESRGYPKILRMDTALSLSW